MKFRAKSSLVRCVSIGLGAAAWLPVGAAMNQAVAAQQVEQVYSFAQAGKPLAQALNDFSRVTGLSVVYTVDLPGLDAPALKGTFSADQALQRLLGNSGLRYRRLNARTLTLEPLAQAGTLNLDPTTVSSQQDSVTSYQPPASSAIMRSQVPNLEIPQAINVVPAQVLKDQTPRNLDDALSNVSGITQGNNFGGTSDTVMKRGFGDNRDGSIMRDGMPIVQGRSLNATTERVEVLKGPASLLYGIQDPGGVINVVSKRPQLQQYNALTVRGSTYGSGKNGSGGGLDSTGALGDSNFAYRLVLDHEDEDYWRNFGTHRETLVAPSLAWFGEDTQVLVAYEHREFLYPFDRGTAISNTTNHPLDIPSTRRLDEPFNNMQGRSDLYRLEVDHQLSDDWKAHFGYSFNRETYDASQVRVTAVNDARGTLSRSLDGTRGAISSDRFATVSLEGKVQLAGLLDQVFTPEQYGVNVETVPGSGARVEFAIRLPGQGGVDGAPVWLPIDAKFPREDYERLLEAHDRADALGVESAAKALELRLRQEARTIRDKYLAPPHTADFAILFVPTEGLYAEALRRPGLVEAMQRECRVMLAGPTTLLATLNSLQMGFRTLALEKRSSEVWQVLGAVKTEFGKFGDVLDKVRNQTQTVLNTLDQAQTRSNVMNRALRQVDALPEPEAQALLPGGDV